MKRQPTERDKIFASCTSDRGVIPRACKKTKKEKPKQEIKPGQHMGWRFEQTFLKIWQKMANKHEKTFSFTSHHRNANTNYLETPYYLVWRESLSDKMTANADLAVDVVGPLYTDGGNELL